MSRAPMMLIVTFVTGGQAPETFKAYAYEPVCFKFKGDLVSVIMPEGHDLSLYMVVASNKTNDDIIKNCGIG